MSIRALSFDPPDGASRAAALLGGDIDGALAAIGIAAFILCDAGVVRWQNAKSTELVGDRRGRLFSSVVAPESVDAARLEFARQLVGSPQSAAPQLVLCAPDGTRSSVKVHTVAITGGGRVVGAFGILEVDAAYLAPPPLDDALTPRQQQVLLALARGASTKEMAASLGLAPETVRNHVRRLLRSLRVHSRLEAVAEARSRGLLGP